MKQMQEIRWAKAYNEELGTKDEDGYYDYAYCYYTYRFCLPDKSEVMARRYTDTPEKCAVFMPITTASEARLEQLQNWICCISKFLLEHEGVGGIEHFTRQQGYQCIDSTELSCDLSDVAFQEIKG